MNGSPSDHFRPSRRCSVKVLPSSLISQLLASEGRGTLPVWSTRIGRSEAWMRLPFSLSPGPVKPRRQTPPYLPIPSTGLDHHQVLGQALLDRRQLALGDQLGELRRLVEAGRPLRLVLDDGDALELADQPGLRERALRPGRPARQLRAAPPRRAATSGEPPRASASTIAWSAFQCLPGWLSARPAGRLVPVRMRTWLSKRGPRPFVN